MVRHIESIATLPDLPDDTALLFQRSSEGRACRRRAVLGQLTGDDRSQVPACFAPLLTHLERPVSKTTGAKVRESDYTTTVDGDGVPRAIDMATVRWKLRSIAKQKAPGLTGIRPRTAFLLEPLGARTRPPRLRVVLVPAPCPCPVVLLLVCYSYLASALLVPPRARATFCLLLLARYSFATRPLLVRYSQPFSAPTRLLLVPVACPYPSVPVVVQCPCPSELVVSLSTLPQLCSQSRPARPEPQTQLAPRARCREKQQTIWPSSCSL